MLKGVHLTLMIGPVIPVPVPQEVLDALVSIEVNNHSGGTPSGFKLSFTLNNKSPLHTIFLVSGSTPIPMIRVVIVATINGVPEVLIDGVMTNHQVSPGSNAGYSTLTIMGEDLTRVMDYIDFSGIPYPAMPAEARVLLILAKYAMFGIIPAVIPSVMMDVPNPLERIPRQKGKDLPYIRDLAKRVGYVFYIEPGPAPGASIAYWGPEIKVGVPQPALNINMDVHTNIESLSFTYDDTSKRLPVIYIQEPISKVPIPIPIPDISLLNPPLGLVPPIPHEIVPIPETAKMSPMAAVALGLAEAATSSDAVTATGSLDVLRYGRILKSRRLVGVRGAGMAFDGLYYVKSVSHNIQRGQYKQNFTLSRNGLISTVPRVPA
jgi:hypothetical protein